MMESDLFGQNQGNVCIALLKQDVLVMIANDDANCYDSFDVDDHFVESP